MRKIIELHNGWNLEIGWGGTCFTIGFGWLKWDKNEQSMFHVNLIFVTLQVWRDKMELAEKEAA